MRHPLGLLLLPCPPSTALQHIHRCRNDTATRALKPAHPTGSPSKVSYPLQQQPRCQTPIFFRQLFPQPLEGPYYPFLTSVSWGAPSTRSIWGMWRGIVLACPFSAPKWRERRQWRQRCLGVSQNSGGEVYGWRQLNNGSQAMKGWRSLHFNRSGAQLHELTLPTKACSERTPPGTELIGCLGERAHL